MLVYSLGGGVNGLITIVQWSVKSHHSNLAVYSYIHILSIDAGTQKCKSAPTDTSSCSSV